MYKIYETSEEFITKNNEIVASGVCGNSKTYADLDSCKHPTQNKWAMSVLHYTTAFFKASDLCLTLPDEWAIQPNKLT